MNRFVIADPKLCIGCYTCMPACVMAHKAVGLQAYPRLVVTHTAHGTMPVQCRHCEDAPCAKVCPVNAITHTGDAIQLNESVCIGCKMCALACPFGAIESHGSTPMSQQMPFDAYMAPDGTAPGDPQAPTLGSLTAMNSLLAWSAGERTVAVKCDLCSFRESGPICVQICPTHALHVVDGNAVTAETSVRRQATVVATAALASGAGARQG